VELLFFSFLNFIAISRRRLLLSQILIRHSTLILPVSFVTYKPVSTVLVDTEAVFLEKSVNPLKTK
jgi:hypothetical protein